MLKLLISLSLAATLPLGAGTLVYTSLTSWQASTPGSNTVLDFESTTPAVYTTFAYSLFTFAASSGSLYVLPGAAAGTGSGHYITTDISQTMNIIFAPNVYGVAFNLGSNAAAAATASIVATDIHGTQYSTSGITTSGPAGPAIFWGLRADVQLSSIRVTFTTAQPQLDNVRYSNTALPPQGPVIPEPAPWTLVAAGGVLLLVLRNPTTSKSARSSTRDARKRTATGWHRTNK